MTKEKIIIFDTTLRDGEQSPGANMNMEEKLLIAKNLERMGVDVIEAGFPAASNGDFEAVKRIASTIKSSKICGLARAIKNDIERAGEALKIAKMGRIHTFISTSPIHMKYQIKKNEDEVLQSIKDSVSLARNLAEDVEFSAMDATRSEKDFLFKALETAIANGARTINIPDTVGYTTPEEFYQLVIDAKNKIPNIDKAIISVHCHNDLGLAVSNSLSAIRAGARQVECTINGLGERAGNCALEEIVMAIKTRNDLYSFDTSIDTTMISRLSKLVSSITGFAVQYNKAIVGANAFAHESGIHQDGVLKNRSTYEIMTPESVGLEKNSLTLGKLSGRAAFKDRLQQLGYEISEEALDNSFKKFKDLADKKREIVDEDLISLVDNSIIHLGSRYKLIDLNIKSGKGKASDCELIISIDGKEVKTTFSSKRGPIDSIFKAINKAIPNDANLELYQVQAVTEGSDSQAVVIVRMQKDGKIYSANGADSDVMIASAKAYINSLEKLNKFNN